MVATTGMDCTLFEIAAVLAALIITAAVVGLWLDGRRAEPTTPNERLLRVPKD